ncbi:hypothetical protein GUJ93_ZPchr0012g19822 [Zizania palustris]|uniref:Uncharacterized protein n=1 Tax=Zizania palustris TaxID=103762 RepID=A0A8J5WU28_ZIZPA|nr:hypothetical protein GUJ93_ZPchr0012g19822 [Zizania palustris]
MYAGDSRAGDPAEDRTKTPPEAQGLRGRLRRQLRRRLDAGPSRPRWPTDDTAATTEATPAWNPGVAPRAGDPSDSVNPSAYFQAPVGQGCMGLHSSIDLPMIVLRTDFVRSQDQETYSGGSRSQANALAAENAQLRAELMWWW